MRRITAIEAQTRAGSRRLNVFLDGRFAFSLAEDLAARLSPGSFLSDAEIAELQRQDDLHRSYDAALTLLSYRPRSVAELRQRLLRKGFGPSTVELVLARLSEQGMLNDQEFARFWVDNRQAHRPRGSRVLGAELRSKGIDRETVDGVLPAPEEEEEAARRAGERKARLLKGLDWREFRRRLGEHLVRRGFGYDTADAVARHLWAQQRGESDAAEGESEE